MAEGEIRVAVRWDGREVERGARSTTVAVERIVRAQRAAGEQAQALTAVTGRLTGAMTTVAAVMDGPGGVNISLQNLAAQAASVGVFFGPQGALVGAIIGATVPALSTLIDRLVDTEAAFDRVRAAGEAAARQWREGQRRAEELENAQRLLHGSLAEMRESELEAMRRLEQQLLEQRFAREAEARAARMAGDEVLAVSLEAAASTLRTQRALLAARRDNLAAMLRERELTEQIAQAESRRSEGAERERAVARQRAAAARQEREREAEEQRRREEQERREAERRLEQLLERAMRPERDPMRELAAEISSELEQVERERREAQSRAMQEHADALSAEAEKVKELLREQHEEFVESAREVTGVLSSGLTEALSAIIAGQQSAEQAFLALLGKFLEFIATKATLKAADEYAEAVAAFARYDYAAGAQHTAAGAAFTALAVAAGAGAIGIASARPAAPPQGQSASMRGDMRREDRTVVIEWNAPLVTAQTRGELGRDLARSLEAGQRRFGVQRVR